MTYSEQRDRFIAAVSAPIMVNGAMIPGLHVDTARRLLRYATTLQRLSEAQCNGDYPADNGERKVEPCSKCGSLWVRSSMMKRKTGLVCKDCRTQELVTAALEGSGLEPFFQGDPRGAVLQLVPAGSKFEDVDCGRIRGIAVPTR